MLDAADRVLKARSELIQVRRFYGVLVCNVEPVISDKVETAATNGKVHYFNPKFVAECSQERLLFVQAHESEHDARKHSSRRSNRDPHKWNIACDHGINIDLKDQGFDVPEWAYCDLKYRGMAAEDVYRCLELDEQAAQQQQQQEEESESDDEDSQDGTGEDGQDGQDEASSEPDQTGDGDTDSSDSESDDAGDEAPGSETSDGSGGDDEGEGSPQSSDSSANEGDSGASEQAGGSGVGSETDGSGQEGAGEPTGEASDKEGSEGKPIGRGDPGRCGEVLDAADDPAGLAENEQKWDVAVRQAQTMAKSIGDLPGHVTREVEADTNKTRDWREELRAWFDAGCLRIETWNRPNRRLASQGYTLPGTKRDGVNKAVFIVDTSGSMWYHAKALECVKSEAQAALDDGVIDEVVVLYGDTQVTRVDEYHTGDEIEFDPRGGGGTDMGPLFQHAADIDASLIVCFTDMEWSSEHLQEPSAPVLFAAVGYPKEVRKYLDNAPWGAPGLDITTH